MTKVSQKETRWQDMLPDRSENTVTSPEGVIIEIPKRSRRGRKSNRKSSHPLRDIRLSRNLTLEELADLSQLSPSYLSRLESGTRRLNVDTINRLSYALQCKASDLLVLANKPSHDTLDVATMDIPSTHVLPVYGSTGYEEAIDFSKPVGSLPCPEELSHVPGTFAVIVNNSTMAPRFRNGDRVLVHPGRPLTPQSAGLVVKTDHTIVLGEFVAWHHMSEIDEKIVFLSEKLLNNPWVLELKQYHAAENGDKKTESVYLSPSEILTISRIVGTVEG